MRDWTKKIRELSESIDACIEKNDAGSLTRYKEELNAIIDDERNTPSTVKSILDYYLANIYQHTGSKSGDIWNNAEYGNAIICHRRFYRYNARAEDLAPQVAVNHANTLSTLCRTLEAIPLWKKGINHKGDPEEVGLYRLATGLLWISQYLYDESHAYYYQLYAYKYAKTLLSKEVILHRGIKEDLMINSTSKIRNFLNHAEKEFKSTQDLAKHPYQPKHRITERRYREWCKDNILFINPLNDLDSAWVVDHDPLNFPSYSVPISEGPYLSASFSSMKNEYCYCRHLFYEGINKQYKKFIDKDKYLTDTLDGVSYEGHIEKIKNAIKGCFSVLDKISRLLDAYYELKSKRVAFNREWFNGQEKLKKQENPFIIALFWLSKDFSQHDNNKKRPSYWLDDSSFEVRELRNELEHGWVRVINPDFESYTGWKKSHDYAYTITVDDLIEKGMYVLKQTRNALIYTCLAINFTEREKEREKSGIILQDYTPLI